jgi:transcriptional regulator with XRE-family HTH domain
MPKFSIDKGEARQFKKEIELRKASNDWRYLLEVQLLHMGETLTRCMEEQCISRTELAERLGVSKANISQILNNKRNIQLDTIYKIATALGLRPRLEFDRTTPIASEYCYEAEAMLKTFHSEVSSVPWVWAEKELQKAFWKPAAIRFETPRVGSEESGDSSTDARSTK